MYRTFLSHRSRYRPPRLGRLGFFRHSAAISSVNGRDAGLRARADPSGPGRRAPARAGPTRAGAWPSPGWTSCAPIGCSTAPSPRAPHFAFAALALGSLLASRRMRRSAPRG